MPKIFKDSLIQAKEFGIPNSDVPKRNELITNLISEYAGENEEVAYLIFEEIRDLRDFYQQGRISALEDLRDAQEKLKT